MRQSSGRKRHPGVLAALLGLAFACALAFSSAASATGTQVTAVSFSPGNAVAGATSNWTVHFTSSASGLIASAYGDYVEITLPDGFGQPSSATFGTGFSCGGGANTTSPLGVTGNTFDLDLPGSCYLGNSTAAVLTLTGVTNPGTAGSYSGAAVSTAADDTPASASDITITTGKATPTLSTKASSTVAIGGTIKDTATLSGGSNPGGSITWKLYGPNDSTCSTSPLSTDHVTVLSNGNYESAAHHPTAAGTYRWIASYSGDAHNKSVAGACNAAHESVVVSKASPTLSSHASGSALLKDTAKLSRGSSPTGTVTFKLYGPSDSTCSHAAIFTDAVAKASIADGEYHSSEHRVTVVGTYRWIASYAGDAKNNAVSGRCNATGESVTTTRVKANGSVNSPYSACRGNRTVTVYRKRAGAASFLPIGSDSTDSAGAYAVATVLVQGAQYQARVAAKSIGGGNSCKAATSETYTPLRSGTSSHAGGSRQPRANFNSSVSLRFTPT